MMLVKLNNTLFTAKILVLQYVTWLFPLWVMSQRSLFTVLYNRVMNTKEINNKKASKNPPVIIAIVPATGTYC